MPRPAKLLSKARASGAAIPETLDKVVAAGPLDEELVLELLVRAARSGLRAPPRFARHPRSHTWPHHNHQIRTSPTHPPKPTRRRWRCSAAAAR